MAIEIELTQGQVATVDDIDADLIEFSWGPHTSGKHTYATRNARDAKTKKFYRVSMHRVVMERVTGDALPDGYVVDHINHDTLDNRRSNLRLATHAENLRNRSHKKRGFSGISRKSHGVYVAMARINHETVYLGTFETEGEAYVVYCDFIIENHGEFACFDKELYRHYKAIYPDAYAGQNARNLTDEQIDEICVMLSQGHRQEEIAEQVNTTQTNISRIKKEYFEPRVERGELSPPPRRPSRSRPYGRRLTEDERQQVYREVSLGKLQKEVAVKWGVTQVTVSRIKRMYDEAQS